MFARRDLVGALYIRRVWYLKFTVETAVSPLVPVLHEYPGPVRPVLATPFMPVRPNPYIGR